MESMLQWLGFGMEDAQREQAVLYAVDAEKYALQRVIGLQEEVSNHVSVFFL